MDFGNKEVYEAYKNGILRVLFDFYRQGRLTKEEIMDIAFNGYSISEEEFETKHEEYIREIE